MDDPCSKTGPFHEMVWDGKIVDLSRVLCRSCFYNIHSMDYSADFTFPEQISPTVIIGSTSPSRSGTAFIYQGRTRTNNKQWSQAQQLNPPTDTSSQSDFGASLNFDHKHHRRLAIGCPSCNASHISAGQVFLYSTNQQGKYWSQTQVLGVSAEGNEVNPRQCAPGLCEYH
jgi:hypothetical protein